MAQWVFMTTREEPTADALWAAAIERRAMEIAQGKVVLINTEDVHAEAAKLVGTRAGTTSPAGRKRLGPDLASLIEGAKQAQ